MADTNSNLRKRMVSAAEGSPSGSSGGPTPKKIKLEVDEPPQANPDTIEAVRQRNTALELDMKEKNRRIAFLARKCEALYRHRVLANASVRSMRRQWFHAVDSARDALRALQVPDDDQAEDGTATLRSFESLGTPHVRAEDLALTLPEWFLSISKGDDRSVPLPSSSQDHSGDVKDEDEVLVKAEDLSTIEHDMQSQLESKRQEMVRLLSKLVEVTTQNGKCGREGESSFSSIVEEKRLALDEVLRLKDQLHTSKLRLAEMERDLEDKETERHRACRDYDRLQKRVEQYGSSVAAGSSDDLDGGDANNASNGDDRKSVVIKDEKSPPTSEQSQSREQALMKDVEIIRDKLFQERRRIDGFRRELNSCRASELALTKEAAALKQEHDDKVQRLQEENARITEEFKKIEHKAKDMGKHLEERWQKKVDKMMADVAKYKTQHDTIQLKNLSLRNKLSDASSSRDQLNELKTEFESVKRENERLKAQVESERRRMDTIQLANGNAKISELLDKAAALDKINAELRKSCDLLKDGAITSGDDKIAAYVARLSQLEGKYEQEVSDHQSTKASLEEMRASMEEMKATADATREESDALLGEIEALGTEMEELRHGRKKLLQQVDEKRNALKKLGSQQQRDEQEKTHSFEEVMATRLQVTSLQAVQKQQKSVIAAAKEALAAKEKELELLKEHVKTIEGQSEANDAEKRKALRDAEVAKQLYATEATKKQQQMLQEKKQACEQCEEHRKKEEKYKEMLAAAKGTGGSSTLSDTEHLELQDLQKAVKCSVCQDRQKTVIISKCFHMFCKECVDNNLKSRNRKCPTCKKMFGQDDVKAVWFT